MITHEFSLILADVEVMTLDIAEALFESGCDDATPHSGDLIAMVDFDREADTLEAAIRSAVADVNAAGFRVSRIEIEPESLVTQTAAA